MATSEKKTYVGTGKAHVFPDGGEMIKFSFSREHLDTLIRAVDNGWVRICISKRRTPSEKGQTHCAYIDTWKPRDRAEAQPEEARSAVADIPPPASEAEEAANLPF